MKKLCVVLIFVMAVFAVAFVGCNKLPDRITLYVPDGAPALSVANIVSSKKIGNVAVDTQLTTGEDVVAKCASGQADMAVLPTNAAVTICNKRNDYLLFSVNVHGVLYVVGTNQIADIAEIKGDLYSIGLSNTPEYVMKTVLQHKGVDVSDNGAINWIWKSDASEIIPLLMQASTKGETKYAVIGEPAVSKLMANATQQGKQMYRLFDLQQLWKEATNSQTDGYPQASMIVKKDLLSNKTFADNLQKLVFSNQQYLLQNVDTLRALMKSIDSALEIDYTAEIINNCNLRAVFAKDIKADLNVYLQKFSALGNFLPLSDDIFYN